jgi:hypothetical protein
VVAADGPREPGRESSRRGRQAPAIPDGATIGPPDFIGVGVHKAGTTWWWALLVGHPEIDAVARRKELHLLDRMREGHHRRAEEALPPVPALPATSQGVDAALMAMPPIAGSPRSRPRRGCWPSCASQSSATDPGSSSGWNRLGAAPFVGTIGWGSAKP